MTPILRLQDSLKEKNIEYKTAVQFSDICYARLGGVCSTVIYPDSSEKLVLSVEICKRLGARHRVIGRMSNVLPPDGIYDGVIIKTDRLSSVEVNGERVYVGCGVNLPALSARVAALGLSGLEELSGIPGSIGGAVYMNAGAFGREISELVSSVTVYDNGIGRTAVLLPDELSFSYRHSSVAERGFYVLGAVLGLRFGEREAILARMREIARIRRESQPISLPSLGSVFKKTENVSAARLIDQAGLKGLSVGGASVSEKHAGFIVNKGGATSREFCELVETIKKSIFLKYGVTLSEEIEYL